MTIIFCRHGQTQFNLYDRFQGISDSPLTELGIEQAKKLNHYLKSHFEHIDMFYLSPQPRVKATYSFAAKDINAPAETRFNLNEVNYGEWEAKNRATIDESILKEREKDRFNFIHPGRYQGRNGESYKMQYLRLLPFFHEFEQKEDGVYVVIAHHGVMLNAYKYFAKVSDREIGNIRISNNQLVVVSREEGDWKVQIVNL